MSGRDSGDRPRMGRRALACALTGTALLAGCSAVAPTTPAATTPVAATPVAATQAGAPTASAGTPGSATSAGARSGAIVLRRTTLPARGGDSRGRAERRETWTVEERALARRGGAVLLSAHPVRGLTPERAASLPPAAVLELPARVASAVCADAPAWRRESRVGALTIVTRGQGDEPWSTIETWSDGRLVSRSRSVWERRRASWQLVSHEDAATAGATQSVAVDRGAVHRAVGDLAVPRVRCGDPTARIVPTATGIATPEAAGLAAALGTSLGPIGVAGLELAGATRLAAEECPPAEDADAACAVQMATMIGAGAAVVGAAAGVWAGCVSPAVVVVATCTAAITALTSASATLAVATDAYQECRDKRSAPVPCSCPTPPPTSPAQLVSPAGMLASVAGAARPLAAPFAIDCTEPPPPTGSGGGGGGDGGGGGGGYWIEICVYTDYYDEYGNYLYSVQEGCRAEWVE